MQHVDSEVWEKEYKDIFFGDPSVHLRRQEAQRRIAPAQKGVEGSLNIKRKEAPKPAPDLSELFGRAGSAGKADPNKAAMQEIGARKAAITIGPDADGNLSVTAPEPPVG
jgi:hypothetical protein